MSDPTFCDVCGARGFRRFSKSAPDGWLYGEARDETTGVVFVISVCSPSCAAKFWQPGPGRLRDGMKDVPPEAPR